MHTCPCSISGIPLHRNGTPGQVVRDLKQLEAVLDRGKDFLGAILCPTGNVFNHLSPILVTLSQIYHNRTGGDLSNVSVSQLLDKFKEAGISAEQLIRDFAERTGGNPFQVEVEELLKHFKDSGFGHRVGEVVGDGGSQLLHELEGLGGNSSALRQIFERSPLFSIIQESPFGTIFKSAHGERLRDLPGKLLEFFQHHPNYRGVFLKQGKLLRDLLNESNSSLIASSSNGSFEGPNRPNKLFYGPIRVVVTVVRFVFGIARTVTSGVFGTLAEVFERVPVLGQLFQRLSKFFPFLLETIQDVITNGAGGNVDGVVSSLGKIGSRFNLPQILRQNFNRSFGIHEFPNSDDGGKKQGGLFGLLNHPQKAIHNLQDYLELLGGGKGGEGLGGLLELFSHHHPRDGGRFEEEDAKEVLRAIEHVFGGESPLVDGTVSGEYGGKGDYGLNFIA